MTRAALAMCLAALACVSHDDATHATDPTAHGAAACPGPVIQSADWREVALERIPVTLRLPPGYVEKRYDVRVGDPKGQTFRGGDFQSLYVDEHSGPADLDSAGLSSARQRASIKTGIERSGSCGHVLLNCRITRMNTNDSNEPADCLRWV